MTWHSDTSPPSSVRHTSKLFFPSYERPHASFPRSLPHLKKKRSLFPSCLTPSSPYSSPSSLLLSFSCLAVIRREAHVRLTLSEMKTLWDTTFGFLSAIDAISGTGGFGLKSTLLTQV